MNAIRYPLIGIIVDTGDHEENHIFTEEEAARVSFEKARKIILQNEAKLISFIHGGFNNMKKAKEKNWYWKNNSAYPPAKSMTFNNVVEELGLCRMNLFYSRFREVLPWTKGVRKEFDTPANLPYASEIASFANMTGEEITAKTGLHKGETLNWNIPTEEGMLSVRYYVQAPDELPSIFCRITRGESVTDLAIDPLYLMEGRLVCYEWCDKAQAYMDTYEIFAAEKELERE